MFSTFKTLIALTLSICQVCKNYSVCPVVFLNLICCLSWPLFCSPPFASMSITQMQSHVFPFLLSFGFCSKTLFLVLLCTFTYIPFFEGTFLLCVEPTFPLTSKKKMRRGLYQWIRYCCCWHQTTEVFFFFLPIFFFWKCWFTVCAATGIHVHISSVQDKFPHTSHTLNFHHPLLVNTGSSISLPFSHHPNLGPWFCFDGLRFISVSTSIFPCLVS